MAEIKRHLRAFHSVETRSESADKVVKCLWTGCTTDIRTDGLAKHLRDVHLRVGARRCSHCGKRVSRKDAMKRYEKRCKALQSALASEGTRNWGYGTPSGH
ncbi:hypothetical protein DAEQUDRAFT_733157 [Daedalea quercina L-15889]|uniref:C2H2-type domain-containing protein n=1 Tax=Daedalea quercina L-15889 TaxID=1314783 RepID=A0A165L7S3_9APHY|nr:hypothetical protein DAEQUDRAFT_733157 [Daedalea quercina L-15889]